MFCNYFNIVKQLQNKLQQMKIDRTAFLLWNIFENSINNNNNSQSASMSESIPIERLTDFKLLECHLVKRWLNLQNNPNAFRYKLNVQRQRVLHGKLNILVQVR